MSDMQRGAYASIENGIAGAASGPCAESGEERQPADVPPRPRAGETNTKSEPVVIDSDDILIIRRGPGANCSSIGSALDILFLSAVAAGAVLAGVAAAFGDDGGARPAPPSTPKDKVVKEKEQTAPAAQPASDEGQGNASST